jgi:hypothetical protein
MNNIKTGQILILAIVVTCCTLTNSCKVKTGIGGQSNKESADAQQSEIADTGWRDIFNGIDLTGWQHVGDGYMTVEDGIIQTHGGMGLLYWKGEKLGNCVIHVEWRMQKKNSNSGMFTRIPIEPKEAWMPVYYGHEIQIDNHPEFSLEDEYHSTGMIYAMTKPLAIAWKPGPEWNTFEITLDGPRTIVYLNNVKVTDYKEGDPIPPRKFDFEPYAGTRPDSGYFGLQNHGNKDVVFYRKVAVRSLKH